MTTDIILSLAPRAVGGWLSFSPTVSWSSLDGAQSPRTSVWGWFWTASD